MPISKEIVEQESARLSADVRGEIHLWKEATFLRAYDGARGCAAATCTTWLRCPPM